MAGREWPADPVERAAAAAALGLRRPWPPGADAALARLLGDDPDPRVRAAALGALARLPRPPVDAWARAAADPDPAIRRRAADLAPTFAGSADLEAEAASVGEGGQVARPTTGRGDARLGDVLLELLGDRDVAVAEAAAWALGEVGLEAAGRETIARLSETARSHADALVREAAVAALGALGDPGGLDAVLGACGDKPAIRRRAVLALAAFEGPEVDAALQAALEDKDWQTRQAAEDLLG
ncbi:MAG TPA: HEAT repeat domain-containing protein [Acidimicrobiia bacterium]|nr:HEAT repeat domain-containing protein [Acidimicrobiia bacterium]